MCYHTKARLAGPEERVNVTLAGFMINCRKYGTE
jgi:hypothetical protein